MPAIPGLRSCYAKVGERIIDQIEYDEGRDPVAERAWEGI